MKVITLNVWGGKKASLLSNFFEKYKGKVDLFCLQEVSHDPQEEKLVFSDNDPKFLERTARVLEDYEYYFHPSVGDYYGLSTFVHEDSSVIASAMFLLAAHRVTRLMWMQV
jgi:exonuclease III